MGKSASLPSWVPFSSFYVFKRATVVVADLNEKAGKETVEELKKISGSNR